MVPVCLYLGFAASIIWVGQGTYLTSTARTHAKDCSLHEGTIIGAFNGEFWGMFASHQVVGILVSLAVLREETDGSASGTKLLFIVFLCSMTFGTILMCFLRKRDSREERASPEYPASFHSSLVSLSKSVITPLFDVRMLLIILLIAYSGLQQAFVWRKQSRRKIGSIFSYLSGISFASASFVPEMQLAQYVLALERIATLRLLKQVL
ncbi:UNC93-like protein 3 [Syzygium oleosum]|uniref:UNC93-like protein 3 n=1 Tax=Syzygium oleosum TaxID=219896 RepID=UPI0024BAC154|nr:UNC93-like protein 3 [Syzygium oleosum]